MGPAPPETAQIWCDLLKSMGPNELESFAERTYRQWDRASLGDLRRPSSAAGGAQRVTQ